MRTRKCHLCGVDNDTSAEQCGCCGGPLPPSSGRRWLGGILVGVLIASAILGGYYYANRAVPISEFKNTCGNKAVVEGVVVQVLPPDFYFIGDPKDSTDPLPYDAPSLPILRVHTRETPEVGKWYRLRVVVVCNLGENEQSQIEIEELHRTPK
jgi:hypothetical protein